VLQKHAQHLSSYAAGLPLGAYIMEPLDNSSSIVPSESVNEPDELRDSSMIKLTRYTRRRSQLSNGLGLNTRCCLFDVGITKADVLDIECQSCCCPRGTLKTSGCATAIFCCAISCLLPCFWPVGCATAIHSCSDKVHRIINHEGSEEEAD